MAHPKSSRNHEESRLAICACCGIKKGAKCLKVFDSVEKLIKIYCNASYSKDCPTFPSGICSTCRRALYTKAREERENTQLLKPAEKLQIEQRWKSVEWNKIRYVFNCIISL